MRCPAVPHALRRNWNGEDERNGSSGGGGSDAAFFAGGGAAAAAAAAAAATYLPDQHQHQHQHQHQYQFQHQQQHHHNHHQQHIGSSTAQVSPLSASEESVLLASPGLLHFPGAYPPQASLITHSDSDFSSFGSFASCGNGGTFTPSLGSLASYQEAPYQAHNGDVFAQADCFWHKRRPTALNEFPTAGNMGPRSPALPASSSSSEGTPTQEFATPTGVSYSSSTALSSSPPLASPFTHGSSSRRDEKMPFSEFKEFKEIICDGSKVRVDINAVVTKNVFYKDRTWTCYRRNYISVECSYSLSPLVNKGTLLLRTQGGKGGDQRIKALSMCLTAVVDKNDGKTIDLVQHTPKRDKGPTWAVDYQRLRPLPQDKDGRSAQFGVSSSVGPDLPFQLEDDDRTNTSAPNQPTTHTFDRIQFKSATANNGRRRAQQQYYHLIVGLYADVRKSANEDPLWTKIAQKTSEAMVVRGRSPGHYNDGNQRDGSGGSASSSGTGGSAYGFGYTADPGSVYHSTGTGPGGSNSSSLSRGYQSSQSTYNLQPVSLGGIFSRPLTQNYMTEHANPTYSWYPSSFDDSSSFTPRRSVMKTEDLELKPSPVKLGSPTWRSSLMWQNNHCGQSSGFNTPRSYYQDLSAGH